MLREKKNLVLKTSGFREHLQADLRLFKGATRVINVELLKNKVSFKTKPISN